MSAPHKALWLSFYVSLLAFQVTSLQSASLCILATAACGEAYQ